MDLESGRIVHKSHALFLGEGPDGICSGARLCRFSRATIPVPCYSAEIAEVGKMCKHCEEGTGRIEEIMRGDKGVGIGKG